MAEDDSARPSSHHHHHHRRSSSGGSSSSSSSSPPAAAVAAAAEVVLPPHLKYSVVQFVNLPKTHVDHTYRDFSENLSDVAVAIGDHHHPNSSRDDWWWTHDIPPPQPHDHGLTFHQRLYRLLSYTSSSTSGSSTGNSNHQYEQQLHHHHHHQHHNNSSSNNNKKTMKDQTIVWLPHGRAFWIVDRVTFDSSGLLAQFFGYSSLRRFEAQLRHHGYKPLLLHRHQCPSSSGGVAAAGGTDSACYYSEVGLMHACILYLVLLVSFVVDLGFGICYFLLTHKLVACQFLLRGLPHLLQYSPTSSDRYSHLLPDGKHEPDLELISSRYPLPMHRPALVREARQRLQHQRGIVIADSIYHRMVAKVQTPRGFHFVPDRHNLARIAAAAAKSRVATTTNARAATTTTASSSSSLHHPVLLTKKNLQHTVVPSFPDY
jgi:hypothetical protein